MDDNKFFFSPLRSSASVIDPFIIRTVSHHTCTHLQIALCNLIMIFIFMILFDNPFIHWLMILSCGARSLRRSLYYSPTNSAVSVWAFTIIMDLSYSHRIFSTNKTAANKTVVSRLLWLLIALSLFRWHLSIISSSSFHFSNDARQQTYQKEEAGK